MARTVTLYAVVFTDADKMTTEHSAHLTVADAARVGGELARRKWAETMGGEAFPEVDDDSDAMDVVRVTLGVQLEVEPIEIGTGVIRTLVAQGRAEQSPPLGKTVGGQARGHGGGGR